MDKCDQITELRKQRKQYGSISDKDLTLEVAAQDWPFLYEKNFSLFSDSYEKSKELEQKKMDKQKNYIYREQEYRRVISDLKEQIEKTSQKPLERIASKSEDQLQMENIKIKLEQNDPKAAQHMDMDPHGLN